MFVSHCVRIPDRHWANEMSSGLLGVSLCPNNTMDMGRVRHLWVFWVSTCIYTTTQTWSEWDASKCPKCLLVYTLYHRHEVNETPLSVLSVYLYVHHTTGMERTRHLQVSWVSTCIYTTTQTWGEWDTSKCPGCLLVYIPRHKHEASEAPLSVLEVYLYIHHTTGMERGRVIWCPQCLLVSTHKFGASESSGVLNASLCPHHRYRSNESLLVF